MNSSTILFLLISISFLFSCNDTSNEIKQKELALKERELDLKEKEIELLSKNNQPRKNNASKSNKSSNKRELRYLYQANAGLIGYFDDGTFVT